MAYKILFTEDALSDLESILDYILAENPLAAEKFGASLLNHVELLQTFPRIGSPVPRKPGIRKFFHSPIRVYYRIVEERFTVEILHFWHAKRKPPKLLPFDRNR